MRIQRFELERWLSEKEPVSTHNLAKASPPPFAFRDFFSTIDQDLKLGYGTTQGSVSLRRNISHLYDGMDEDNILVTTGTAEADYIVASILLDRDREVVVPVPSYLNIVGMARTIGSTVLQTTLPEDKSYELDLDSVNELVSERTKMIWLTNPNNPTGAKLSADKVRALCEIAEDANAFLVFDEALRGLELDGVMSPSPVSIYDKAVCTGSLTKMGFPALRIGWIIGNRDLIQEAWAYKDYTTLSHSALGELLAEKVLERKNVPKIYERNRSLLRTGEQIITKWMTEHRDTFSYVPPKAGASAFPGYMLNEDAHQFCNRLLKEERLLLVPGDFFGVPRHFRILYGQDTTTLEEGLKKLGHFVAENA